MSPRKPASNPCRRDLRRNCPRSSRERDRCTASRDSCTPVGCASRRERASRLLARRFPPPSAHHPVLLLLLRPLAASDRDDIRLCRDRRERLDRRYLAGLLISEAFPLVVPEDHFVV